MQELLDELSIIERSIFEKVEKIEPMADILNQLKHFYDEDSCDYLFSLVRTQKLIINYVKIGNFQQAEELIELGESILSSLRGEPLILGKTFLKPSIAYYFTKTGRYSEAVCQIHLMCTFNDRLTKKFPVLHLHKIHHVLNLAQVHQKSGEVSNCFKLFGDFFEYFYCFRFPKQYGEGSADMLKSLNNHVPLFDVYDRLFREYFMYMWRGKDEEIQFLKSGYIDFLYSVSPHDESLKMFKAYFKINSALLLHDKICTAEISRFYKSYNYYLFDPFRLLILRALFLSTSNTDYKNQILKMIEKLNFKEPELLKQRLITHE